MRKDTNLALTTLIYIVIIAIVFWPLALLAVCIYIIAKTRTQSEPEAHQLFHIIPGPVAEWEVTKSAPSFHESRRDKAGPAG